MEGLLLTHDLRSTEESGLSGQNNARAGFQTRPFILCALCTAICCENLRGLRKILRILKTLGYSSRQGAKTLSLKMIFPLRLRVFAGDTPNLLRSLRPFLYLVTALPR
jgi:hypothetical protein